MNTINKTLLQLAKDIENKDNLHEYVNADNITIKMAGFGSFDEFIHYFRAHYVNILEQMANGLIPYYDNARLLRFMADDLLRIFSDEESERDKK